MVLVKNNAVKLIVGVIFLKALLRNIKTPSKAKPTANK